MDTETMLPLNVKTHYMDLAKANSEGHPTWEFLDDILETYDVANMSPANMKNLATRMKTDSDLANEWTWNESRRAGAKPTSVDQASLYCTLVSSEMWERHECELNGGTVDPTFGTGFTSKRDLRHWSDWFIGNWITIDTE